MDDDTHPTGVQVNWSRIIGNIGRTLIGSGTLILLFVAYQLWGTAIQERRAQSELTSEFEIALDETLGANADTVRLDDTPLPSALETTTVEEASSTDTDVIDLSALPESVVSSEFGPPPPPAEDGEAIAKIRIPRIGMTKTVVEGVTTDALKKGPGHYPGTPLPGQAGNASIAGHRTTHGQPFHNLDELEENDLIYVTTLQGSFVYRVTETVIVAPRDVYVLDPTEDHRLTLTTCHPKWTARQRMIVVAELLGDPAEAEPGQPSESGEQIVELPSQDDGTVAAPTTISADELDDPSDLADLVSGEEQAGTPTPTTTQVPDTPETTAESATSFGGADGGLSGKGDALWPAIFLGLLTTFIGFAVWMGSKHLGVWQSYVVGAPIFLISLFYFFESFSVFLPANY
ncbi:MAG: class E sortase [Actinomycetia bacterium]|nr:class E sortase [Actinomycetes bacterium]